MNHPVKKEPVTNIGGEGSIGSVTLAMCPHCSTQHIVGQSCPTFPVHQQENYKDCGEGNGAPGRATLAMCPHCHSQHIVGQSCPTFVSSSPHQETEKCACKVPREYYVNSHGEIGCMRCTKLLAPSPHQEAWAERFEKRWFEENGELTVETFLDIKDFIRQELTTLHKADCERFRGMLQENNRVIQHKYQMQGERSAIRYETSLEIRRALADMTENVLTALQKFEEEKV